MRNQNELARAQNYAATINEERDALIEVCSLVQYYASGNNAYAKTQELLSKIDGLEEKRLIKELETEVCLPGAAPKSIVSQTYPRYRKKE